MYPSELLTDLSIDKIKIEKSHEITIGQNYPTVNPSVNFGTNWQVNITDGFSDG